VNVIKKPKAALYMLYLVLPAILLYTSLSFKEARGPYFIGAAYDPEYAYLLGSLNAANFRTSNLFTHPGTPVQIIGGAVLRAHSLNYANLQNDVLKRPEHYLSRLNGFILGVNVIMLIFLGMTAFFLTGDIIPGLIVQMTPFLSCSAQYSLARFNTEPFLIMAVLMLIGAILIKTLKKSTPPSGDNHTFILACALIGGFGLAIKIPFMPLLLVPLFMFKKFSSMVKYGAAALVFFFLLLLPYYHHINIYFRWLWKIIQHTGQYGEGKAGFIDFNTLLPNIETLFRRETIFTWTLSLSILFILVNLAVPRLRQFALKNSIFKALMGLVTANIVCSMITLKHFALKYLLAGFSLTGIVIALIYLYISALNQEAGNNTRWLKSAAVVVLILIGIVSYRQMPNKDYFEGKSARKMDVYGKFLGEYSGYKKIFYYGSTSKRFALSFGNEFAAFYHSDRLESIYGNEIFFYNVFIKSFLDWHKVVDPAEVLQDPENTVIFGPALIPGKKRLRIKILLQEKLPDYTLEPINVVFQNRDEQTFKLQNLKSDKK
jgi:hypothetical protein